MTLRVPMNGLHNRWPYRPPTSPSRRALNQVMTISTMKIVACALRHRHHCDWYHWASPLLGHETSDKQQLPHDPCCSVALFIILPPGQLMMARTWCTGIYSVLPHSRRRFSSKVWCGYLESLLVASVPPFTAHACNATVLPCICFDAPL